jgi:hypothetical protein
MINCRGVNCPDRQAESGVGEGLLQRADPTLSARCRDGPSNVKAAPPSCTHLTKLLDIAAALLECRW